MTVVCPCNWRTLRVSVKIWLYTILLRISNASVQYNNVDNHDKNLLFKNKTNNLFGRIDYKKNRTQTKFEILKV